jgi:hypothetical protein
MEDMSIRPKTSKVINICGSTFWIYKFWSMFLNIANKMLQVSWKMFCVW